MPPLRALLLLRSLRSCSSCPCPLLTLPREERFTIGSKLLSIKRETLYHKKILHKKRDSLLEERLYSKSNIHYEKKILCWKRDSLIDERFTVRGEITVRREIHCHRYGLRTVGHPGGNPGANLKSTSHRCYLFEVAFVWEVTKETIVLPQGCLQGGVRRRSCREKMYSLSPLSSADTSYRRVLGPVGGYALP